MSGTATCAVGIAALFVGYLWGEHAAPGQQIASTPAAALAPVISPASEVTATDRNVAGNVSQNQQNGLAAALSNLSDQSADPAPSQATEVAQPQICGISGDAQSADSNATTTPDLNTVSAQTVAAVTPSQAPTYSYSAPSTSSYVAAPSCGESGSCYGDISSVTGLPKTTYVHGYFRQDGTYVRSYYRSHR